MKVSVFNSYAEMSREACIAVLSLAAQRSGPLICPASGDTPKGLYAEIARASITNPEISSSWKFVGLDEWVGMNGQDEGSCRHSLDDQLFLPLNVPAEAIQFFDGRSSQLVQECRSADNFIELNGPIDISILGLGMNGHIGFNEPGVDPRLRSHIIHLDETTKNVSQKYFSRTTYVEKGITLGLKTILESTHLVLLVSGRNKAAILKRVLLGERTNEVPASILCQHPNLQVFCDADAAAELDTTFSE